ncbi:hypothetical protein KIPB_010649 [Kipferlia bialata]|uniref:Uncharacterized protein n=1 Tax=Kipferlia bialata TaxID=797122 RepID=A0A9K3GN28_9EUKA|nr:hypothetical protein KIPB_010649 [Kipferlia bialata]|eukprot:g10649.t1
MRQGTRPFHTISEVPQEYLLTPKEVLSLIQSLCPSAPPRTSSTYKRCWDDGEHQAFIEGLKRHGRSKWKEISLSIPTRTPAQVQSHAQKFFLRLQREGTPVSSITGNEEDNEVAPRIAARSHHNKGINKGAKKTKPRGKARGKATTRSKGKGASGSCATPPSPSPSSSPSASGTPIPTRRSSLRLSASATARTGRKRAPPSPDSDCYEDETLTVEDGDALYVPRSAALASPWRQARLRGSRVQRSALTTQISTQRKTLLDDTAGDALMPFNIVAGLGSTPAPVYTQGERERERQGEREALCPEESESETESEYGAGSEGDTDARGVVSGVYGVVSEDSEVSDFGTPERERERGPTPSLAPSLSPFLFSNDAYGYGYESDVEEAPSDAFRRSLTPGYGSLPPLPVPVGAGIGCDMDIYPPHGMDPVMYGSGYPSHLLSVYSASPHPHPLSLSTPIVVSPDLSCIPVSDVMPSPSRPCSPNGFTAYAHTPLTPTGFRVGAGLW